MKKSKGFSSYLCLVENTLNEILDKVLDLFKDHLIVINKEKVAEALHFDLSSLWQYKFEKSIILELHQSKSSGLLIGNTPELRFQFFIKNLSQDNNRELFWNRYPVFKKQIFTFKKNYLEYFNEFILRLKSDIGNILPEDTEKYCIHCFSFLGDPHNNFRRVMLLEFVHKQKAKFCIVYKPRPIKNEVIFNKVISWFNQRDNNESLSHLQTLSYFDREVYGWCEYVEHTPCTSLKEVEEYYFNFGMLVAIAYILGTHDIHYENLITKANQPTIIDLECLGPALSAFIFPELYEHTVLKSGMLLDFVSERNSFTDVSAFAGGGSESEIPFQNSYIENDRRDDAFFARKGGKFMLQKNRCLLNGESVIPYSYKCQVVNGFKKTYSLILKHKKDFINFISSNIKDLHTRIIFRPTAFYLKLESESYHPSLLHSIKAYKNHFSFIKESPLILNLEYSIYRQICKSELKQLKNLDVPIFTLKGSKVYDGYGTKISIPIKQTSSKVILRLIQKLSKVDLQTQLGLLHKNLDTYYLNYLIETNQDINKSELNVLDKNKYTQTAIKLMDNLIKDSINIKKLSWPEHINSYHEVQNKNFWLLGSSVHNLYSGSLGVLLALIYLQKVAPNEKYLNYLRSGFSFLTYEVEKISVQNKKVDLSLFSGIGGMLYIGIQALELKLEINSFIAEILELIKKHLNTWLFTFQIDIISGIAGLILVLDLLVKKNIEKEKAASLITICRDFC